jgi:hypothetical protein
MFNRQLPVVFVPTDEAGREGSDIHIKFPVLPLRKTKCREGHVYAYNNLVAASQHKQNNNYSC